MNKKIVFYSLLILAFVLFTTIAMAYLNHLNFGFLIAISLIVAVLSRKTISYVVYGSFKESE